VPDRQASRRSRRWAAGLVPLAGRCKGLGVVGEQRCGQRRRWLQAGGDSGDATVITLRHSLTCVHLLICRLPFPAPRRIIFFSGGVRPEPDYS